MKDALRDYLIELISGFLSLTFFLLDSLGVILLFWPDARWAKIAGLLIFALSFGAVNFRIYWRQRQLLESIEDQKATLQRQLSPRLNLVFGDFPSCIHQFKDNDHVLTLFRVGLINQGASTIENVHVSLERLEPQNITYGPIKLLFMNQRQADREFRLHPDTKPSLFVDVIQDGFINDPPERIFRLRYVMSDVKSIIEPGNYRLTLLAGGQDVQPCRKSFLVTWNGEDINFMEERSAN